LNVNLFNCLRNYKEFYNVVKDIPSQKVELFNQYQKEIFAEDFKVDLSNPDYVTAYKYAYILTQVWSGTNPEKGKFIDKGSLYKIFSQFKASAGNGTRVMFLTTVYKGTSNSLRISRDTDVLCYSDSFYAGFLSGSTTSLIFSNLYNSPLYENNDGASTLKTTSSGVFKQLFSSKGSTRMHLRRGLAVGGLTAIFQMITPPPYR
jgi:hypothetical protein